MSNHRGLRKHGTVARGWGDRPELKNITVVPVTECSGATKITLCKCLHLHKGNCYRCYGAGTGIRFQTADGELSNFVLKMCVRMHAKLLQTCPTLCDPTDCSPPGSSVHGILQARELQWVAMPFSRGSSQPRNKPITGSSVMISRFSTTSVSWDARSPQKCVNRSPPKKNWKH